MVCLGHISRFISNSNILLHTEPRPRSPFVEPPHNVDDYAKLIVQNLRTELEQERQAHTLDRENSEKEILSLRAKLARREAELESCIYHTGADRNFWHEIPDEKPPSRATSSTRRVKDTQASRDSSRRIPASSLTRDEMAQILGIAGARNRSLEGDIYGLSESVSNGT